jgi:hypothetical protein
MRCSQSQACSCVSLTDNQDRDRLLKKKQVLSDVERETELPEIQNQNRKQENKKKRLLGSKLLRLAATDRVN